MNDTSIIIRLAGDSDQERWDDFVLIHPDASPYHLFAWKKAIEAAYKHKCLYLYAEKNNEIKGVLALVHLYFPGIINEIVGLPFCDVGNCIAENEDFQDLLLNETIDCKNKLKAKNLQIRGNLFSTDLVQSKLRTIETEKVRMFLNLPPTTNDLLKSFKSKLRSQVRKAEKNNVSFRWGSLTDLDAAYEVFSKNMHELGSPVHSKTFLDSVLGHFGERAKFGIVEFDGKMIGMGVILLGGNSVSIPWASTLREYNRLAPNMLLYWNFLKYSTDNGYTGFDFGRSSEGEGTYKFKKQWGASPKPLVWYESIRKDSQDKNQVQTGTGKRELLAAIWQKMPLGVANMIGPHLRKYISL